MVAEGLTTEGAILESPAADDAMLFLAHDPGYVAAFEAGELGAKAMKRIGLDWTETLVQRVRSVAGGAIAAAEAAMADGVAGQIAGGAHHAHRDHGAGYCIYNDQAVAALMAVKEGWAQRVAIVDLDVHQGDGTAAILEKAPQVFVASLHGEKNYPFPKPPSDLDVGLPDGTGDDAYLAALDDALASVLQFRPDLVLYQAGVDPLAEDRLGRLSLTMAGLAARDRMVFTECQRRGIPVSIAMGGGYAEPVDLSIAAYAQTYRVAREIYRI
jgi:acetoin utilization deacetylase AcuC-like enzyme